MNQPHDDVDQFAFLAIAVDLEQIRMVELRKTSRLVVEAFTETDIAGKFWMQDLDGYIGVQRSCGGTIDTGSMSGHGRSRTG